MILSSEKIFERNIVQQNGFGKPAQVGIDLTICAISQIIGGTILTHKSTIIPYQKIETDLFDILEEDSGEVRNVDKECFLLPPGVYSLTFNEGVNLDENHCAFIIHRSSILRVGSMITSGVFDPGFKCNNIGATLFVFNSIKIEKNARVAQIVVHENYVSQKYDGNYQAEKDLK